MALASYSVHITPRNMQMLICRKKIYTTLVFMNLKTALNLDCAEMQFIMILVWWPV